VVRGPSCLAHAIAHDIHDRFITGAACLLIDVAVVIGCGFLMGLFAPLLAGLNALLSALAGDDGWRFPTAARGRLKLGRLSARSVGMATSHCISAVLLGALVDTRRGRGSVLP
jgi:hypothetical protein